MRRVEVTIVAVVGLVLQKGHSRAFVNVSCGDKTYATAPAESNEASAASQQQTTLKLFERFRFDVDPTTDFVSCEVLAVDDETQQNVSYGSCSATLDSLVAGQKRDVKKILQVGDDSKSTEQLHFQLLLGEFDDVGPLRVQAHQPQWEQPTEPLGDQKDEPSFLEKAASIFK